jgi:sugar lactone lactonase YvrE
VAAPGGALIAVELTAIPFVAGSGRVLRIGTTGQVETLTRGTTTATGVAMAGDGTIYVVEHSASLGQPPFLAPGTGRVVRVQGDGQLVAVAEGLMFPTHALVGPDGGLYLANASVGGDNGEGQILRLNPGAGS